MTRRTLLLSAALLSLAAPGALGTWRTADSMEPDTSHDVAGDRMWRDPPPAAGRGRVYFEATLAAGHEANPMGVRANPNAGALGTRVMPGGTLQAFATLGVWSDCDGDGFVGAALGQVTEYRVELLDDPSACPARHVRNGTVYELLWILPPGSLSRAPHLADADAAVWGDFGRPGDRPHLPCALTPLPAGAAARTGGLLVALDCHAGFTVTQALDEADPGGRQGIGFDDPYHPERDCDHALNRPLLLGRDPNRCAGEPRGALDRAPDDPAVGVFDCGARTPVRDPTAPEGERGALSEGVHAEQPLPVSPRRVDLDVSDEEGTYAWLPAVSPRVDREGSIHATLNDTENAAARGCEPRPPGSGLSVADYLAENWQRASTVHDSGAPPPDPSTPKRAVDFPMQASGNGQQGGDTEREGVIVHASTGLGVAALERQLGQGWRSVARTHAATGNSVRGDLQPKEAVWTTFHARVGASTLLVADVPAGPAGVYGAEACGDAVEGERGGWDCDATRWPGSPWRYAVAGFATVARPGDRYHLRDVDCLDGAVAGDLRAGLVDAACPAP